LLQNDLPTTNALSQIRVVSAGGFNAKGYEEVWVAFQADVEGYEAEREADALDNGGKAIVRAGHWPGGISIYILAFSQHFLGNF
jgi:hypothetical protein